MNDLPYCRRWIRLEVKFNESYDRHDFFSFCWGSVLQMWKRQIAHRFTNNQSVLCGSKRYQFTTANRSGSNHRLFIRCWAFCQSRGGSCPKHHIRRNVCFLRWPRKGGSRGTARGGEDEARGKLRQEPPPRFLQWLQTSAAPAATRFFVYPLPPQFAPQRNARTRVHFPFSSEAKGCVSIRGSRRFSKPSLRFRFFYDVVFSFTDCTVGNSKLIYIDINIVQLKNMYRYLLCVYLCIYIK